MTKTNVLRVQDIASLTDFHRNSRAHWLRLKRSGRPALLTINGKVELVVQDAAAYQRLLSAVERARQVLAAKAGSAGMD
jgi:hypothetical protein